METQDPETEVEFTPAEYSSKEAPQLIPIIAMKQDESLGF